MIGVVVCDDHALIREGTRKILREESDIKIVGEAGSAEELLAHLNKHSADVVILDVSLPERGGLDILKDLRKQYPKIAVLIQTMHGSETIAHQAIKSGAQGFLSKSTSPTELIKAIRRLASGRKYIPENLIDTIISGYQGNNNSGKHEQLSSRELDVFRLIVAGHTIKRIASELHLSIPTVHTYRARILEKLHCSSNAELIHYSIRNKLFEVL